MEFLRQSRRRSLLSEIVYIALNLLVAIGIFAVVYFVGSPFAAFGIVLLSKWRVLAVRPQYWGANVMANLVDMIVGLSFVVLLSAAAGQVVLQVVFTVLYVAWLLFLKPQSKRVYVIWQAGIGLFIGTAALLQVSYDWWSSIVVVARWLIGYSTARHALGAYREPHTQLLSLVWGLIVAELGWIAYHWTLAYQLPFAENVMIAQMSLIIIFLGFLAERTYASYHKHEKVLFADIILPLLLTVSSVVLLLTLFGGGQTI